MRRRNQSFSPEGKPDAAERLLGLRNAQRPERQPFGAMAVATNVVADNTGTLERRDGYSLALAATNITDAYAHQSGQYGLVVADGRLLSISQDLVASDLGAVAEQRYQWAQHEDRVAFAGYEDSGLVQGGRVLAPLRIPHASFAAAATSGSLPAGAYQVTAALRHAATGVEGPAAPSATVDVREHGGIHVAVDVPAGYEADVYVTEADGTVERYVGSGRAVYYRDEALGAPLTGAQAGAHPLPYGITALCFHEASLWAAIHDKPSNTAFLLQSEPWWPQLFRPAEEGFALPGEVLGMASTAEGLLAATDRAIWLRDRDGNLQLLADYGVVPGRPFAKDQDGNTAIWTKRGMCLFPPFRNLYQAEAGAWKLSVPPGHSASASLVNHKGLALAVALTDGGGTAFAQYS